MANIQHSTIADPNIHEPKGVAAALTNTVYASNGVGSGVWKAVDSKTIKGLTGDGGSTNKRMITDGANGFVLKEDRAYGSMVLIANTANFAVTAAADPLLNTNTDYALFTGEGAPLAAGAEQFGVVFSVNKLTVPVTGVYTITLWATVASYPTGTARISVKYRLNGTGAFSARHPMSRSTAASDIGTLTGFGSVALVAGDSLQLYFASNANGNLVISDLNTELNLIRAT